MSCKPVITLACGTTLQADGPTLLHSLSPLGHYSECRNGYCGACKTTKLSGDVKYLKTPMAFLKPGEILPCCCQATTNIKLDLHLSGSASSAATSGEIIDEPS